MENENTMTEQQDIQDRKSIAEFFLRLHRHHYNVDQSAASQVRNIGVDGSLYTYELEVDRDGLPETRRMTISLIGDGGGSKSKCFKVSYDDLLVIKIPPKPIETFEEYVESISAERKIAAKLAPDVEFVAPGIAVIMKRVHTLADGEGASSLELERKYIKWLRKHRKYQRFLKVKGSFVFVMDLSRHAFLSEVLDRLHLRGEMKEEVRAEIIQSHDLVWDVIAFEEKYGDDVSSVSFDMPKVFSEYETEIRNFLDGRKKSGVFTAYDKHQWLIDHLAEKEIKLDPSVHSEKFQKELNSAVLKVMEKNRDIVQSYRNTVRNYIRNVKFSQNKAKMGGITTNVTELLACLNTKGLAIRDLKPDNLFVVGSPELNPFLFSSADAYSLGLIDFETAVLIKPKNHKQIQQPLRAGTPSYATPLHMFKNEILQEIYGDLHRILHLQDWHAVVGIIYNVVTGETLFEQTRKWLSKIKEITKKAAEEKRPPSFVVQFSGKNFWSAAQLEFRKKTEENEKALKSIEIILPETFHPLLKEQMDYVGRKITKSLQKRVISQVIFSGDKNRNNLIKSSYEEIHRYRLKWEQGGGAPKTPPETREQIVSLLKDLERLKALQKTHGDIVAVTGRSTARFTVLELMQAMFHVVIRSMYNEEWGELKTDALEKAEAEEEKSSHDETTILYESTIMYE